MRRRSIRLRGVIAAFAALLCAGVLPVAAQDVGLPLGSVPEAVALEDLDGATVDLAQYIGRRPVLLQFWASWCDVCEALEPKLQAVKRQHGAALEIVIVAVGVNQTVRTVRRHVERHTLAGRVLYDARGRATRAFRAPATSYIVALDAQGRVVYTGIGADQDLAAAALKAVAR
jgi:thiol-disulfide isomerase/thioredoxin